MEWADFDGSRPTGDHSRKHIRLPGGQTYGSPKEFDLPERQTHGGDFESYGAGPDPSGCFGHEPMVGPIPT